MRINKQTSNKNRRPTAPKKPDHTIRNIGLAIVGLVVLAVIGIQWQEDNRRATADRVRAQDYTPEQHYSNSPHETYIPPTQQQYHNHAPDKWSDSSPGPSYRPTGGQVIDLRSHTP